MDFSANHTLQVGQEVSTLGNEIAIADTFGRWTKSLTGENSKLEVLGEAVIRIQGSHISTDYPPKGLVCFLPAEFRGIGIKRVKITTVHNKSVDAIPTDIALG